MRKQLRPRGVQQFSQRRPVKRIEPSSQTILPFVRLSHKNPYTETVIRESIVGIPAPDHSAALAQDEYVPDPMTDTFERRGRHGLDNGPIDQDPPERATT